MFQNVTWHTRPGNLLFLVVRCTQLWVSTFSHACHTRWLTLTSLFKCDWTNHCLGSNFKCVFLETWKPVASIFSIHIFSSFDVELRITYSRHMKGTSPLSCLAALKSICGWCNDFTYKREQAPDKLLVYLFASKRKLSLFSGAVLHLAHCIFLLVPSTYRFQAPTMYVSVVDELSCLIQD